MLLFGLGIRTISSKTVNGEGSTTAELSTFVVKPLVRKYWNFSRGLFFYGQAALPIMMRKDKVYDGKNSSFALELAPGFENVVNK
jgi:hypothetical protein